MSEQEDHKKITVKLILSANVIKARDNNDDLETQKKFNESCKAKEDLFSSLISNEIEKKVGKNNWSIVFDEITDKKSYEVDIYCPEEKYFSISAIIKNNIKGVDLTFTHKKRL